MNLLKEKNKKKVFRNSKRYISNKPEKMLDAPQMKNDDFYSHLLDWSSKNILGVALGESIYLWNYSNQKTSRLYSCKKTRENDHPTLLTSVEWHTDGIYLACGRSDGKMAPHFLFFLKGKSTRIRVAQRKSNVL